MSGARQPSEKDSRSASGRNGARVMIEGGVLASRLLQLAQHIGQQQTAEDELMRDEAMELAQVAQSSNAPLPLAHCTPGVNHKNQLIAQ